MKNWYLFSNFCLAVFATIVAAESATGSVDRISQRLGNTSCISQRLDKEPRSVTIVTREQILQQTAITRDLSQILNRLVPGSGFSNRISLRGRRPSVLVDGVPTAVDPSTIDPLAIERIEVIPQRSDRCPS